MNKLWTIAKNEFCRYFFTPLAYVYLIGFLLLNGSFAFYFGHFFERGQADLLSMFSFQPWIYLLFIPGISMRLWAEEFRSKTILQLVTLPVSLPALVWGKFLASWLFCALALVLTFPFWIIVNLLGSPDNAVIAAGYFGSLLLAGCMLAISQTMSALTKNQVIALVLAVIANLFFFLSGLEYILEIFRGIASPAVVDLIASFSFLTHFDTVSRGLLELRDLVFFGAVILLFNITTVLIVSFRTKGTAPWLNSPRPGYYILVFVLLLTAFCGVNLLANNYLRRFQADFTEEKIFTLTPSTQKVISDLKSPVIAKLYYSPILGQRNPDFRLMFDQARLLLRQYAELSAGRIEFHIYNPLPLGNAEDRAIAAGLQPLPVIDSNINAYFGLVLSDDHDRKEIIPFFPLERQNFLEQDLTEAFYRLGRTKPKLGLITSLPMYEDIIANVTTPKWEILNQLSRFYEVVPLDNAYNDLAGIDVLMMAHPRDLSEETVSKIRDFSFKGGKILALFDIAPEALPLIAPMTRLYEPSDYGTLPQDWGFRFLDNAAVADLDNSSLIDATVNYQNNPEFTQDLIQFYLRGDSFNPDSPVTAGLKKMMVTSASVFAPLPQAQIKFTPLLEAGTNSELLSSRVVYDHIHPAEILRQFKPDSYPKYLAAHIVSTDPGKPFELIAVGDSDLLYDNFWTTHQTILERNFAIPVLDNANFVLNALDALRGDDTLLSLRGKSYKSRPFERVEAERINAARNFKIREKEIFDNLDRAKAGMTEIIGKRLFENRETFTPDELAVIAGIRKRIDRERQQLYSIRAGLNQNINRLKNNLKFAAVYAIPGILLIILIIPLFRRRPSGAARGQLLNRQLVYVGAASLLLLGAGLASVWQQTDIRGLEYENRPLFGGLAEQINDISSIRLQNSNSTLIFNKQENGLWQLEGYPHYLVYQNRIRSFLSALLEAAYYEKKASGLENLPAFGLTPIESGNSPAVQVTLSDNRKNRLLQFDVGKYDLDLGRGSRGAYIRFDNSFQVWLAQIDLIDLSLNPLAWTYSTLWNLQFGRVSEINGSTDPDALADIVKELLNIHFAGTAALPAEHTQPPAEEKDSRPADSEPENAEKPIRRLDIRAEGGLHIIIRFYQNKSGYLAVYQFNNISSSKLLQNFAAYAKDVAYQISAEDMNRLARSYHFRLTDTNR